jgi:hypothetical protein
MRDATRPPTTLFTAVLLPLLSLAGCGDDGGGSDPCAADVAAICSAACACDTQGGADDDAFCEIGDATSTIAFSGQTACEELFVSLGCTGDFEGDLASCADNLNEGVCSDDDPAAPFYVLPPSCPDLD